MRDYAFNVKFIMYYTILPHREASNLNKNTSNALNEILLDRHITFDCILEAEEAKIK